MTRVKSCDCVAGGVIRVKSAGQRKDLLPVVTNLPFNTRNNGAQFQDEKYGKGRRLHNIGAKDASICTVCGKRS